MINGTDATIRNCYFANNSSAEYAMPGGGVLTVASGTFRMTDCVFTGNVAHHSLTGAGITIRWSDAILTRCTVVNNFGGGGHHGGGIGILGGQTQLIECYIADNDGGYCGGGVLVGLEYFDEIHPTQVSLTNCTITGNAADEGGGIHIGKQSELTAFNTDIRDNMADIGPDGYCVENSTTLLTCCDVVEDQWFIEEGALWELDNSDCGVATESKTWSDVKAMYR